MDRACVSRAVNSACSSPSRVPASRASAKRDARRLPVCELGDLELAFHREELATHGEQRGGEALRRRGEEVRDTERVREACLERIALHETSVRRAERRLDVHDLARGADERGAKASCVRERRDAANDDVDHVRRQVRGERDLTRDQRTARVHDHAGDGSGHLDHVTPGKAM